MGYTDKELRDATQIAYMDLSDGYNYLVEIKNEKPPFSIRQIINSTKDIKIQANLEDKIKEGDISIDLDSWKITQIHDTNDDNGFYGCIIETSNNEAIVAFRGSEEPNINNQLKLDWIDADIGLLNSTKTLQHEIVDKFIAEIKNNGYLDKYTKIKDLAKYAITLITNKAARDKLVNEVAGKIRDYSAGILEELKKAYSLIISEEFFDMRIWNKKYLQEKWYGRLLLSPIQAVAFSLAGSVLDAGIGFLNKVTGVFEEVQELDDSFAKFLNTKADELNAVAELLD